MNVILIILDTLQRNYLGAYGGRWVRTPNMDKLAGESCVFTNAYPESLPTLQVRTALHTGRRVYPFREDVRRKGDMAVSPGWGPIPEEWVTISEILQERGYRTGLITDTFPEFRPGKNFHRGFDQYTFIRGQEDDTYISGIPAGTRRIDDYYWEIIAEGRRYHAVSRNSERLRIHNQYFKNTAHRKNEEDYFAPQVFSEAAKWLYQNQDARNLFLVVDSLDPHEPWDPPTYYRKLYDPDDDMDKDIIWSTYCSSHLLPERQLRRLKANYAGEITMVDRWLGYFLDTLEYMDILKKTLVVLISDHGHHVGEKNLVGKFAYPIFPEVADLVLFIRDPKGRNAGHRVDDFVYDMDVTPTILSFLGLDIPQEMEGVNLIPVMDDQKHTNRDHLTVAYRNNVVVKTRTFWYIGRLDRSEEMLFDIQNDPELTRDLAGEKQNVCEKMHRLALEDAKGPIPEYIMNWPKYKVFGGLRWPEE